MKILDLLFGFKGRVGRLVYLGIVCLTLIALFTLDNLTWGLRRELSKVINEIYGIVETILFVWILIAASVKRYHDTGRPGWELIFILIPVAQLWLIFVLFLFSGTDGANKYGNPTKLVIAVNDIENRPTAFKE